MIVLAVALTFNISDIIQRDIPNYTEAIGNSVEKNAGTQSSSVSLQACQQAALYGGQGPYSTGLFTLPGGKLETSTYALGGAWDIGQQAITAGKGSSIKLAFHASKVYLDVGGTVTIKLSPELQAYSFTFG